MKKKIHSAVFFFMLSAILGSAPARGAESEINSTHSTSPSPNPSMTNNTEAVNYMDVSTKGITHTGTINSVSEYYKATGAPGGGMLVFVVTLTDQNGRTVITPFYPYHISFQSSPIWEVKNMYDGYPRSEWDALKKQAVYHNLTPGRLVELIVRCGNDQLCYSDTVNILK